MKKKSIGITLLVILLLSILRIAPVKAQGQGGGWSEPYRLSSLAGSSSEGFLVADQYGYVHCFWTETLFANGRVILKYARFDGITWTKPNDIFIAGDQVSNISPAVDRNGVLHIVWSEGQSAFVYYSHAPANGAWQSQNWSKPLRINVPARPIYLQVDSKGVFHILYILQADASGVFYIRSEDQGITWSEPLWLDPDIPPGYVPDALNFVLDENDGLHAAWFYGSRREGGGDPDWVRYIHSLDGGHTWSAPHTIDRARPESDYNLNNASPRMIVQGKNVHIIWAAGGLPYRQHSYSTDDGVTWSTPVHIFGDLHGQAFDGLAVDGAGRVHFFGQIRYPMGIYHAVWDQSRWSLPSLVYLVAQVGEDFGTRVHAHDTRPVVRAGNQLVLTFADGPADPHRRLFVTYRTLEDIPSTESMPTPAPTVTPVQSPTPAEPTPLPQHTPTASNSKVANVQDSTAPDLAIRVALVPTLLVLGATMYFQLFRKRKR